MDPFIQRHFDVLAGMPLAKHAEIRSPRTAFLDGPRRKPHVYAMEGDWRTGRPAPTVYYLGVPDTPEFTTEAALEEYLASPPSARR